MSISPDVFRTGKKYRLRNFDEVCEFSVESFIGKDDYKLKDLNTLEVMLFSDLTRYGRGKDYLLEEI
ncbi:MAG: hypothetical protein OEX02_01765 [Cyclobacteriaceae bacterium]|nr:hypothetical protein [Cyclobacteriaceae bacterium]